MWSPFHLFRRRCFSYMKRNNNSGLCSRQSWLFWLVSHHHTKGTHERDFAAGRPFDFLNKYTDNIHGTYALNACRISKPPLFSSKNFIVPVSLGGPGLSPFAIDMKSRCKSECTKRGHRIATVCGRLFIRPIQKSRSFIYCTSAYVNGTQVRFPELLTFRLRVHRIMQFRNSIWRTAVLLSVVVLVFDVPLKHLCCIVILKWRKWRPGNKDMAVLKFLYGNLLK